MDLTTQDLDDLLRNVTTIDDLARLYQNRCQDLARYVYEDIHQEPLVWGKAGAMIVLSFSIILGNLLVILAVLISHRLRTVTNFFIASLAVSDFVIGVGVLPFSFTQDLLGFWNFGYLWCRVWLALDVWVSTASIYNLVVIALDRYVAVTRPLSYRSLVTPKKAALAVCGAWIWSFLVSFPPMVTFQNSDTSTKKAAESDGLVDCQCTALDNSIYYIFFSASSSFYLPFIALLYIYVKIYIKIRRATAAVDKGYVTLKRKQLLQMTPPVGGEGSKDGGEFASLQQKQRHHQTGAKRAASFAATSPSRRLTWKVRRSPNVQRTNPTTTASTLTRNGTIAGCSSPSSTTTTPNLETIALRVHRGRYNAAGATNSCPTPPPRSTTPRPSPRVSRSDVCASSGGGGGTPRRLSCHLKTTDIPSVGPSGDFDDDTEMDKEEALQADRQMAQYVRRMSKNRRNSDPRTATDAEPPNAKSNKPNSNNNNIKTDQHQQPRSPRYFLEVRRESTGSTSLMSCSYDRHGSGGDISTSSSPKHKVRARLHERYDKKLKREVRAAKTVALVTGCFFVCWSGFCVVYTMKALPFCQLDPTSSSGEESCVPSWAFTIVLWLGYTNSALNPLIYAVCNRQFRLTFKRILLWCCCGICGTNGRGGANGRRAADRGSTLRKRVSNFVRAHFGDGRRRGEKDYRTAIHQTMCIDSSTRLVSPTLICNSSGGGQSDHNQQKVNPRISVSDGDTT